jgi:hypothetical protein
MKDELCTYTIRLFIEIIFKDLSVALMKPNSEKAILLMQVSEFLIQFKMVVSIRLNAN